MRRVLITHVIWYTGNEVRVLRDPTGNRRFVIVYSEKAVDEDWLRLNGDQLLAQAYIDMEKVRAEYSAAQQAKGINEEYPKYLELPRDLWDESKRRSDAAMVVNESLDDWVQDVLFQPFVAWPDIKASYQVAHKFSIRVLTRDIMKYLSEHSHLRNVSDQTVSTAMQKHVVLAKEEYGGSYDVKWVKAQIKTKHKNLNGYRIDFVGDGRERAFELVKQQFADESASPEANFIKDNSKPM